MCGKEGPGYSETPFFWTSLFGKNLRYVGHCKSFDELIVDGELAKLNFVAYYCSGNEVKAVATMARDPVAVAVAELMRMGKMPSKQQIKDSSFPTGKLVEYLKSLNRR